MQRLEVVSSTGQFSSHLRHELRTPLNHVIGYTELLMESAGVHAPETFARAIETIHAGGRSLLATLENGMSPEVHQQDPQFKLLKSQLGATAASLTEIARFTIEELELGHRQILADMQAVTSSLQRLLDLVEHPGQPYAPNRRSLQLIASQTPPAATDQRRGRILIADDDAGNRALLRRRLEKESHEVLEAENGLEALTILGETPCDLLLLDILMPHMDGFQTLTRLKQDTALREVPVIMISALDELEGVARCIEMGAEDYLPKPFNRVILRARIGATLDKKWLRDCERRKTAELEETLRMLDQTQRQLEDLASRDPLTGLPNRRSVDAELELRIQAGRPFSVLYVDVDAFKSINDTHGHHAGDEVLRQIAARLRETLRPDDFIGRVGGDEFVAMVNGENNGVAAVRLRREIDDGFLIRCPGIEKPVRARASIGIAAWMPGLTAAGVIRLADQAMYEEKLKAGRQLVAS